MSNVITNTEVSDWLDTFDGNDAEVLLTAIANNEIKIEVMNDSIYAFSIGEIRVSKNLYKEMWRWLIQSFISRLEYMHLFTLHLIQLMKNRYRIKIVSYDPVKYDLDYTPLGDQVCFTVGYLVQQDNKITHTAWFTNKRALFRHLDKFLNK
mgnify:CR=1 FL=1